MKKYVVIATTLGFVLFIWFGSQLGWFGSNNPDSFPKRLHCQALTFIKALMVDGKEEERM
ncbi:hypothetical protein JCM19238_4912 [Vibrio ponticus]|nr:hypothetical protein JCM19238_4912 [Vibrio ponticus]